MFYSTSFSRTTGAVLITILVFMGRKEIGLRRWYVFRVTMLVMSFLIVLYEMCKKMRSKRKNLKIKSISMLFNGLFISISGGYLRKC